MRPSVALVTYSVKPRGGVVHLLSLAEALAERHYPVEIVALGDPAAGFFRDVAVPCTFVPAPHPAPDLEGRVFDAIDALTAGFRARRALPPILHVQDCIAARATMRVRDEGLPSKVLRTVHHVDDFTTPALIECQRRSILDPDRVLVVSRQWQRALRLEYGVQPELVTNGVDVTRFAEPPGPGAVRALRARAGATERPLVLTVGGIEPRKGTDSLFRALARLRTHVDPAPVLAIIGGHSFQDHREYRERVIASMDELGLAFDRDVVLLGTVKDDELAAWYHAADVFAFPSVNEGWGLVVLEAMAAGTPVVVSDLPVFREYLTPDHDVLMAPPHDTARLAEQLARLLHDADLAARLAAAGRVVAGRHTWAATAAQHVAIYEELLGASE